jgi:hypothetical protein
MKLPPVDWNEFRGYTFCVWLWVPKLTAADLNDETNEGSFLLFNHFLKMGSYTSLNQSNQAQMPQTKKR